MVNPSVVPKVTFNNGHQIPIVGLGTWQSEANGAVYKAVKGAIENGYRHIDCAHIYQNQEEIGQALTDVIQSGVVKREELFITSKVWLTFYRKDRVAICVKKILADLKLEYIDLILLHWPFSFQQTDETLFPTGPDGKIIDGGVDYLEAYKALEPLVEQGLIKSIGISNFTKDQVERVVAQASIKPVTNQVECHPYLNQEKLRQACQAHGIVLTAYSPLGNPGSAFIKEENKHKLLKDEVVTRLAAKYGKNAGQILIKFQVQRGIIVIPKSVTLERIVSNIDIFDFELTKEELDELLTLNRNYRSCNFDVTTALPQYPFKPEIEY